ncbi:T-complex protein 1 subunit alpha like [Verticillium longisporum]|uniref:T-complex protein 1 subunit alpha n=1 Tax=Verticillium longisporum TaxID=100787 RepID=A0A8I3A2C6_VERLO|nr:T-complex protein 1 subunit alpha like [Verticillium longisporum]
MASMFEQSGSGTLFLGGQKISGSDIRDQNVLATQAIANVVKCSFGPSGLDKMMVDDIGDVTVTNDGATILSLLDVEHPAGKILVDLAQQQDKEVGDGTTSVVLIASELLRRGNELMNNKIHPTTIITGYRLALREAVKYMNENISTKVENIGRDSLINIAKTIQDAKIAVLDMNLQKERMKLGVQITVDDPQQLEQIRAREAGMVIDRVEMILKAGANVILTTKGIDDLVLKMFVERGAMGVRRCKKEDLRRIARATGATLLSTLSDLNGDEKFDPAYLGHAEEVVQERISDDECILVKGTKSLSSASIILRGPNDFSLDEMERSVHDSLCAVKRTLESGTIVPGGGAVETALHIYLEEFAGTVGSREQLAIAEFAQSLLVIPKTLAVNAAKDASELVAQLRSRHALSQRIQEGEGNEDEKSVARKKAYKNYGLDLTRGKVIDEIKAGVLEPTISKTRQLKSAVEACISIMRIDTLIKLDPEQRGEEDDGHGH